MKIYPPQPERFPLPRHYRKPILFLDRDGIVNIEKGHHVFRHEQFDINESVVDLLHQARTLSMRCVVVTNQSGIATGKYQHQDVRALHRSLREFLRRIGLSLDAIFYSPHKEGFGRSLSRKPGSLMIERGLAMFRGDNSRSWLVGDKPRDVEAAQAVGVGAIEVEANSDLKPVAQWLAQEIGSRDGASASS
jgi:D-glycero-D-manno-heptose 1,7-bisphosphate phosphatase